MNNDEKTETIQVRCDIRRMLKFAAEQSLAIQVLLNMGLDTLLGELAEAGRSSSDPQLRKVLYTLGLAEDLEQRQAECNDRLKFWKWKSSVLQKIFDHPAMGPDSTCSVEPNLDSWDWDARFRSGATVDEMYAEADAILNIHGW